ncbi:sensor histidine kinase [Nocardiopsis nanhaiensis]
MTTALPAALMAVLAAVTVLFVLAIDLSDVSDQSAALALALSAAGVGALLILFLAAYGAGQANHQVDRRVNDLRACIAQGQANLRELTDRVRRSEHPESPEHPAGPARDSDPFTRLAHELAVAQHASETAVVEIAGLRYARPSEQQVEVFVNVARRMQSLVHREITLLDELESQVEDPDLLKGLFTIDHLATRMRRQSESLAVLGGAASRRKWSKPVSLYEVLRSAVAEVEHYSRVKVVPPVTGTLNGSAVVDVIHLVAELIENATKFSPPHAQIMLRAESVPAGVAIDIEDRGLGMQSADIHRMNSLLSDPGQIDIGELLRDGRIGLYVVSALARKHSVRVELQRNVFGGTQAIVLLPNGLVGSENQKRGAGPLEHASAGPEPVPTVASVSAGQTSAVNGPTTQVPARPFPGPSPVTTPSPVREPAPVDAGHGYGDQGSGTDTRYPMDRRAEPARAPFEPAQPPRPGRSPRARDNGTERTGPDPDPTPSPPAPTPPPQGKQPADVRPPLPERQVQTHLAPELCEERTPGHRETGGDHTPDLMSAFQSGFKRAEAENANDPLNRNDSNS